MCSHNWRPSSIIIIVSMEVLGSAPKIGNPGSIDRPGAAPGPAAVKPEPYGHHGAGSGGAGFGSGAVVSAPGPGDAHHIPLKALNPYLNRWTVKARVTAKTQQKSWSKGGDNSGTLFSITLLDAEGTESRATFFREAVAKFYDMLQVGQVSRSGPWERAVVGKAGGSSDGYVGASGGGWARRVGLSARWLEGGGTRQAHGGVLWVMAHRSLSPCPLPRTAHHHLPHR